MRNWMKPAKYSGTVSYPLSDLHSSGPSNDDTAVSAQVRVEYYATHEAHTHLKSIYSAQIHSNNNIESKTSLAVFSRTDDFKAV